MCITKSIICVKQNYVEKRFEVPECLHLCGTGINSQTCPSQVGHPYLKYKFPRFAKVKQTEN